MERNGQYSEGMCLFSIYVLQLHYLPPQMLELAQEPAVWGDMFDIVFDISIFRAVMRICRFVQWLDI